jgi:hypothetical protein
LKTASGTSSIPSSSPSATRAQLLRPYPHFDGVSSQNASWAQSTYHALEAKIEKRYANGVSILGSYTYSKLLDVGNGPFGGETLGGGAIQNWYDLSHEFSPSRLDQTNRFIVNAVYELPVFKNSRGVTKTFLGGWQLAAIWSAFSGGPLGITSAVNNTFSQGGGQRPNWTGVSPKIENPTPQRWFDTSQFSNPPQYTFGNIAQTLGGLRSDGTGQLDATITKNFAFFERFNLQFRSEFFNLTNTVRFNPPNQVFGNPQFATVTAQANQPRVIQFALKLSF